MAKLYDKIYFKDAIVDQAQASLSVASSAVLYGLSVYTVFHVTVEDGKYHAFRMKDHYRRLVNSCRTIGIEAFDKKASYEKFSQLMSELLRANAPTENVFVRVSIHVDEILPGTRSRGLDTTLSAFIYEAAPIVPLEGARLKTSVWRRTPDYSIPSRAKVNGAYINSVLARQDAIDAGYDDSILLDNQGHVTELSAANIFIVRDNTLITPGASADILEGINRRTVIELAKDYGYPVIERPIDLTELYVADEAFACGTSAFLTPVTEIDGRPLASKHPVTQQLRTAYKEALYDTTSPYLTIL